MCEFLLDKIVLGSCINVIIADDSDKTIDNNYEKDSTIMEITLVQFSPFLGAFPRISCGQIFSENRF